MNTFRYWIRETKKKCLTLSFPPSKGSPKKSNPAIQISSSTDKKPRPNKHFEKYTDSKSLHNIRFIASQLGEPFLEFLINVLTVVRNVLGRRTCTNNYLYLALSQFLILKHFISAFDWQITKLEFPEFHTFPIQFQEKLLLTLEY